MNYYNMKKISSFVIAVFLTFLALPDLVAAQELITVENQSVYLKNMQIDNSQLKKKNNEALAFIIQQEKAIKMLEDELYRYYLKYNTEYDVNSRNQNNSGPSSFSNMSSGSNTVFVRDTIYKYIKEPVTVTKTKVLKDTVYIRQQSAPVVQTKYITEYVRDTVYKYIEKPVTAQQSGSLQGTQNTAANISQLPNYGETLDIIQEMRQKVADIDIQIENGLITLTLPSDLVYSAGYDNISTQGATMINALIPSMKKLEQKHQIIIIAHTDDISYQNTGFNSNWQLSAENASAMASMLLMNGISREHLKAYGRAEHDPLVPNDSQLNRRINRRMEIIFKPDLERIYAALARK